MMQQFEFIKTEIDGLIKIIPFNSCDKRGFFTKDYSKEIFEKNGVIHDLKEIFYTKSHKGVVRGLHFQRVVQQAKLVRCIDGKIFDVVVDLRKSSPTFKKWLAFELTGENQEQLLIPHGCGHGFMAIEDSLVCYKCDEFFDLQYDDGIKWNDEGIGIVWPLEEIGGLEKVIQSDKDINLQTFSKFIDIYGGF